MKHQYSIFRLVPPSPNKFLTPSPWWEKGGGVGSLQEIYASIKYLQAIFRDHFFYFYFLLLLFLWGEVGELPKPIPTLWWFESAALMSLSILERSWCRLAHWKGFEANHISYDVPSPNITHNQIWKVVSVSCCHNMHCCTSRENC